MRVIHTFDTSGILSPWIGGHHVFSATKTPHNSHFRSIEHSLNAVNRLGLITNCGCETALDVFSLLCICDQSSCEEPECLERLSAEIAKIVRHVSDTWYRREKEFARCLYCRDSATKAS